MMKPKKTITVRVQQIFTDLTRFPRGNSNRLISVSERFQSKTAYICTYFIQCEYFTSGRPIIYNQSLDRWHARFNEVDRTT